MGREIADFLGVKSKGDGCIYTNDGVVTWGFGHLLELQEPEEYDSKWAVWTWESLPIIPEKYEIRPKIQKKKGKDGKTVSSPDQGIKKQLGNIGKHLKECSEVVIATDADREGESIGRNILKWFNYRGATKRLWLSALDPESIRKAIANPKGGMDTINYYFASEARSIADWLVGMTMSRAFTIRGGKGDRQFVSIGRIQTPTLALIVRREREIANFKPENYFEIEADATDGTNTVSLKYAPKAEDRILKREDAESLLKEVVGLQGNFGVTTERKKTKPPKLFSLPSLQKLAIKKFGMTAKQVLDTAQSLYETHKYTSYPRTDCEFLPEEQIPDMSQILGNVSEFYPDVDIDQTEARKEVFNSKKVTAHHALIPTKVKADLSKLNDLEKKIYLLVAGRYIEALMPDYEYDQTNIILPVKEGVELKATGNVPKVQGWKSVNGQEKDEESGLLPPIENGSSGKVEKAEIATRQTKPPSPYTESTLLADMENVSKYVEDKELKKILKGTEGLGTPATRDSVIETLISKNRAFVERKNKILVSTQKGRDLIELVERVLPVLADPAQSGIWEQKLEDILQNGRSGMLEFIKEIEDQIRSNIKVIEENVEESTTSNTKKETGINSFHPDHTDKPILEDEKSWHIEGYGRVFKRIMNRDFTFDEVKQVLLGNSPEFTFKSKPAKGKPSKQYKAKLEMDGQNDYGVNFKLVFPEVKTKGTGVIADGEEILDSERFYEWKGKNYPKVLSGKKMLPEDIKLIVESSEPVEFHGFIATKTNRAYKAKVKHTPDAKYTTEMIFEKRGK